MPDLQQLAATFPAKYRNLVLELLIMRNMVRELREALGQPALELSDEEYCHHLRQLLDDGE